MNIKDIARLAGVSVSTVSKIVNKKDQSISKETRERVLKIVREYNYTPYASSASSKTTTGTIGVLINSTVSMDSTLNGIINKAQEEGYSPIVFNSAGSSEQELKNLTALLNRQVDGLLWEPVAQDNLSFHGQFKESGIPVLFIGEHATAPNFSLPYEEVAYFLTSELIKKKHKKIACLLGDGRRRSAFLVGYKRALYENDLPFQESLVISVLDETISDQIIGGQISGFVSSHLYKSLELFNFATQSGLRSPKDYSLLSLLNDYDRSLIAESSKISTLTINNALFGEYLSQALIKLITRNELSADYRLPFKLDDELTLGTPEGHEVPRILVVGSINMDTYLYSPQLPHNGATNFLSNSTKLPGGKGFNQAVGTSRLGQQVRLIGCVGSDMDSNKIFQELERYEVNTNGMLRSLGSATGQAYIFVESSGDSMISILPGANNELTPAMITRKKDLFTDAKLCLIQTEIPLDAVEKACHLAKERGIPVILKPSGSKKIPKKLLKLVDYLIPNEDELANLCPEAGSLEQNAQYLLANGVKNLIVTLGKRGCFLKTAHSERYFPASNFTAVDSTGASDAFISALAAYLMRGCPLENAIQIATHAAGFSVSRDGVLNSLIDKATLESYLAKEDPQLLIR